MCHVARGLTRPSRRVCRARGALFLIVTASGGYTPRSPFTPPFPTEGPWRPRDPSLWRSFVAFRTNPTPIMETSLPQRLQKSVSGSFHKTALLQKRVRELIRGATPLVETREVNPIKIAFLEMERGLIELIPDEDTATPTL